MLTASGRRHAAGRRTRRTTRQTEKANRGRSTLDFYLWFRWKDPELKPYESFSVVDGRIESRTDAVVRELPDGERDAYTRVVAKITRFFDVTDYPLDNHQLAIIVEEEDLRT